MRIFVYFVFILFVMLLTDDSQASLSPALVRIRMQKDLTEFPQIPGSFYKKIGENLWTLRGDKLSINKKNLPPNNYIIQKENDLYDIISVVDFNEYLAGVVANEMPVRWPLEALKAQAVVARSYALARIKERNNKAFHLESDQGDQVYLPTNSQKTKQAVEETQNLILIDNKGLVLKAFYHADCGGETVPASQIWGAKAVDSGTAKDPWCAQKHSNRWSFEITKEDFVTKLELGEFGPQARVFHKKKQLMAIGERFFSIQKLREIFGFYNIRSSADSINITDAKVQITGQGFGHGAGLCQWGTLAMVRLGKSYLDVIEHYYPKAKIEKESLLLTQYLSQSSVSN